MRGDGLVGGAIGWWSVDVAGGVSSRVGLVQVMEVQSGEQLCSCGEGRRTASSQKVPSRARSAWLGCLPALGAAGRRYTAWIRLAHALPCNVCGWHQWLTEMRSWFWRLLLNRAEMCCCVRYAHACMQHCQVGMC